MQACARIAVAALFLGSGLACASGPPPHISGTVAYRERIALPTNAVVRVTLAEISRQDVAPTVVAETRIEPTHQVPIPFELEYDPGEIESHLTYAVRATIRRDETLLFTTDRIYPVLTRGAADRVDLILVRSGGTSESGKSGEPVADADLVNTRWLLRTLNGNPISVRGSQRTPHLQFKREAGELMAFGFGGCNQFRGVCQLDPPTLKLGPLASTQMACPSMDLESRFHRMLSNVESFDIQGTWLVLSREGKQVASFEAWYE
jgi:putative lipoprotein